MSAISKHVATIKQQFRIGQKVWTWVMGDLYQFTIIGRHAESDQWQLQWLTGPGSFYVKADQMQKRKP